MVKPVIRDFLINDSDELVFSLINNVYKLFTLEIGDADDPGKGSDRFFLTVCSMDALMARCKLHHSRFPFIQFDHIMIVEAYDEERIKELVIKRVNSITGKSWHEVAEKLNGFLEYEFNPSYKEALYFD